MYRSADEKRISCKRCQTRKIKCSRTLPCRKCAAAGVKCEYREHDSKRAPITREYVTALECRIACLEESLAKSRSRNRRKKGEGVESVEFGEAMIGVSSIGPGDERKMSVDENWRVDQDGTSVSHAPTSIYNTNLLRSSFDQPKPSTPSRISDEPLPRSPAIDECLALYFRWHNPSLSLLEGATFHLEYSAIEYPSSTCSTALIYAMSALGALVSPDLAIRDMAETYSLAAEKGLNPIDIQSSVASVRAYMLCAVYQAGQGKCSKAWIYSGIAFRMAQNLGLSPEEGNKSGTFPADTWKRMHMNCYISDKSPPEP